MNYHTLYQLSKYLKNDKTNKITPLNKYNQGYKNTYLYKPLPLRIHYKNIKQYLNRNYKLKVYGINTLEELKEITEYNVDIIGIEFNGCFNSEVDKYCLPSTLKIIKFGKQFNKPVDNLPQSLESIVFGSSFNQNVDKLPQNLKSVVFDTYSYFNQNVDKLPQSLEFVFFGESFNQNVDNLPQKLKSIIFGRKFNQNVDKLPQNLESIVFSKYYYRKINKLPQKLKKIKIHKDTHISNLILPQNVRVERYG